VRPVWAVFRKEMRAYFVSPIPYVLLILFSVGITWAVFEAGWFFVMRQANLDSLFSALPVAFALAVPAISMRLWSEETRGGTVETLMTFPAKSRHLVLGKFLAAWTVIAACLASTVGVVVTVAWLGDLDTGPAIGGFLGAMLLGGAYLALGQWLSGLTRNQIVAFLLALVACFVFGWILERAGDTTSGAIGDAASSLSVAARFRAIGRGVLDVRDLAYFASFIAFFLYLNAESIENRRYR
jgi:gliding motility-associated transport system permease protein